MIIRILGEGQFTVPDAALDELNAHDDRLQTALDREDGPAFAEALADLLAIVHLLGTRLPDDVLVPSVLILPRAGSTPRDVRALMDEEGLVPG